MLQMQDLMANSMPRLSKKAASSKDAFSRFAHAKSSSISATNPRASSRPPNSTTSSPWKSATKWKCSSSASKTTKAWSSSPRRRPPTGRTGTRSRSVFAGDGLIKGKVKSVVKGGLMVNIGVEAFLPASQIDIIPPKDLQQFVGNTYDFKIVKINDDRKNVVLSRRELIEQERSEKRQKFLEGVKIGDIVQGTVKNLTDFGAFIDLDGMDGLLHITDMTWGRLGHPSELLKVGQQLEVIVLDINKEKERVSLGLKQTQKNPWDQIEERFPAGQHVKGKITNLVPYGAFVEIEEGVEGLIHVSELSWTKRIMRPSDVLTAGQEVEAVVLGVNKEEQKISLGVRQLEPNPWDEIEKNFTIGSQVKGTVRNMTAYGAFVELEEGIDGMIHVSDLSWTRKINHPTEVLKKGDEVEAVVIDIDKMQPAHQPRHQAAERRSVEGHRFEIQDRRSRQRQGHEARQLRRVRAAAGRHRRPRPHLAAQRRPRREGEGRAQGRPGSRSPRHQGGQSRAPHRSLDQGRELLRRRTEAANPKRSTPSARAKTWSAWRKRSKPPRKITAPANRRRPKKSPSRSRERARELQGRGRAGSGHSQLVVNCLWTIQLTDRLFQVRGYYLFDKLVETRIASQRIPYRGDLNVDNRASFLVSIASLQPIDRLFFLSESEANDRVKVSQLGYVWLVLVESFFKPERFLPVASGAVKVRQCR